MKQNVRHLINVSLDTSRIEYINWDSARRLIEEASGVPENYWENAR